MIYIRKRRIKQNKGFDHVTTLQGTKNSKTPFNLANLHQCH